MRLLLAVDLAAPEDERAGERREAGRHVDDRAAGEVEHAPLAEQALRMPRPVRQRTVDEQAEQRHEQQVAREAHPLGERAGDQRRRDDRELQLKEREQHERNRRRQIDVRFGADAVQT